MESFKKKKNNTLNAFVIHCYKSEHNFNLNKAILIKREINLKRRMCIERVLITESSTVCLYPGSCSISRFFVELCCHVENI